MKVVAEKVGAKRIFLRSPWSPSMPERCKALGGRWSGKAKAWTYPLDLELCRKLRVEFGSDLEIGPELWAWATAETKREKNLHSASGIKDMDVMSTLRLERIEQLNPGMWEAMQNRPYQPVASYYCAVAGQSLLADQPGVGKTLEALGALIEAGKKGPVLVLAPLKSTQAVWEPEIHRWMADYKHGYSAVRVSGLGKGKKLDAALQLHAEYVEDNPEGLHFLIANAEMCRVNAKATVCPADVCNGNEDWCPHADKHRGSSVMAHPWLYLKPGTKTVRRNWSAILADETHQWLINTRGKSASQVGHGFTKLKTMDDNFRIAMTGTPLKGKKHNLFGTINWLRPDIYTSKWRWIESYFDVEDGEHGGRTIKGFKEGSSNEAFFRALRAIMIRRTKRELRAANPAWMPPDKQYHDVWVEMPPKQERQYRAMEKASEVKLASGMLSANGTLAEFTRLKQLAGMCGDYDGETFTPQLPSAKFDWLLEFLDERGIEKRIGAQRFGDLSDEVQKVVVASQFTGQLDVMSDELGRLGIRHTMITGKTKDALHEMKLFQTNPAYRLCLINTKAGGVSITLDAADDIVLLDETWVPDEQEQVEDRVHRASNVEHQVDVWYLRTKGTIEEQIALSVQGKAESNHVVLDAQRGLTFARTMEWYKPSKKEAKPKRKK